jgi:hypothetical protein
MTLQQKLAQVQTEFKSKKSRFNSFGKYYFRSAEDILEAIKPFLLKYGITVTVDEELIVEGPVPVIKTTATIHDDKGQKLGTSAIVGVDLNQKGMQVPQQFGSASSYGKKYALGNLFLIDDTKDSDATNKHGVDAATFKKAQDYVKSGGKIDAIKKKYQLTPNQEKELTTL